MHLTYITEVPIVSLLEPTEPLVCFHTHTSALLTYTLYVCEFHTIIYNNHDPLSAAR
jgi:hypothetical protein